MDFLWFRSGLPLSKRFLGSSPAGHIGHEHGGKNYHQQANDDQEKFHIPRFAFLPFFFSSYEFPLVKTRGVA